MSRSPRSVWVEINFKIDKSFNFVSRSPRSVWVEMCVLDVLKISFDSHAPHGACELKSNVDINITGSKRHAPHGACELKSHSFRHFSAFNKSRSPRSVWVEILIVIDWDLGIIVTLPTERVSWNWERVSNEIWKTESRSPRSVWVEILNSPLIFSKPSSSRSPRSVWVEIVLLVTAIPPTSSRSPRSVWVEMRMKVSYKGVVICHAPHGACELKSAEINGLCSLMAFVTLPTERVSWNV